MRFFPGATSLLKGATIIDFWFLKNFLRIFNFIYLWLCIKESNYLHSKRGLLLFKGLCLLCLPNIPGAMFIQGGTFIPDSRVCISDSNITAESLQESLIILSFKEIQMWHKKGIYFHVFLMILFLLFFLLGKIQEVI